MNKNTNFDILKKVFLLLPAVFLLVIVYYRYNLENKILSLVRTTRVKPIRRIFYAPIDWLSVDGNKIIDEEGKAKILRGVNIGSINWGYDKWNPRATNYAIKKWNANIIRTRIYPNDFFADKQAFYQKMEEQVINPARKKGVYVILHSFMEESPDDLPDQKAIEMWGEVAKHYKNDPIILYDPIPEPHNTTKEKLRKAYTQVIEEIREVHPKSLILVTGLGWGREINSYLENPLPYKNIVYRSNPYNRAGEFEGLFGEVAKEYPVFLTEFGAGGYPPMSEESVEALLAYADKLGLGWTAWHFHSEGCPCLLKDYKTFEPSNWGSFVYEELQKQPQVVEIEDAKASNPSELVIYSDSFRHGFVEQGWDREIELQSTELVYQGENSIKLKYKKEYAGLGLHTYDLVDTKNFTNLQFFINFFENEPFDLMVNINDAKEQKIGEVKASDYQTLLDNNWIKVKIPLKDFELENELLSGMAIREASGASHSAIFIDEIKIIR